MVVPYFRHKAFTRFHCHRLGSLSRWLSHHEGGQFAAHKQNITMMVEFLRRGVKTMTAAWIKPITDGPSRISGVKAGRKGSLDLGTSRSVIFASHPLTMVATTHCSSLMWCKVYEKVRTIRFVLTSQNHQKWVGTSANCALFWSVLYEWCSAIVAHLDLFMAQGPSWWPTRTLRLRSRASWENLGRSAQKMRRIPISGFHLNSQPRDAIAHPSLGWFACKHVKDGCGKSTNQIEEVRGLSRNW